MLNINLLPLYCLKLPRQLLYVSNIKCKHYFEKYEITVLLYDQKLFIDYAIGTFMGQNAFLLEG